MIVFSPKISQIIAVGQSESFFCFHLANKDGSIFRASTTFFNDVTLENGVRYFADDLIVSLDPPRLDSTVDREQYRITCSDPNYDLAAAAEVGLVGKLAEVRLCFIDTTTGLPATALADTLVVYRGKIDQLSSVIETEESGESLFNIVCASPMLSLMAKNGLYLSRDFVRSRVPLDSCCDQIYEGSAAPALKWGRA